MTPNTNICVWLMHIYTFWFRFLQCLVISVMLFAVLPYCLDCWCFGQITVSVTGLVMYTEPWYILTFILGKLCRNFFCLAVRGVSFANTCLLDWNILQCARANWFLLVQMNWTPVNNQMVLIVTMFLCMEDVTNVSILSELKLWGLWGYCVLMDYTKNL